MGKLNALVAVLALEAVYLIRLAVQTNYDWALFGTPLLLLALWVPDKHLISYYRMARWVMWDSKKRSA